MASFKSIWAIVSEIPLVSGAETDITLKSGGVKKVKVGLLIGTGKSQRGGGDYLYSIAQD